MDQAQKDMIDSFAFEISQQLRSDEFAKNLELLKLVSRDQSDVIMSEVRTDFSRNLKLLGIVRESDSETAYSDLIDILEDLDAPCASKLVIASSKKDAKPCGFRQTLNLLKDRFGNQGEPFPLGMDSGYDTKDSFPTPTTSSTSTSITPQLFKDTITEAAEAEAALKRLSQTTSSDTGKSSHANDYILQRRNPHGPSLDNYGTQTNNTQNSDTIHLHHHNHHNRILQESRDDILQQAQLIRQQLHLSSIAGGRSEDQRSGPRLSVASDSETGAGAVAASAAEPVIAWHPYEPSYSSNSGGGAGSPGACSSSPQSTGHNRRCYSSASSESGDSSSSGVLVVDPNHILDLRVMDEITKQGANMMSVQMAKKLHNNPREDYKMTSKPRGFCLIVNNINFEDGIFPTRTGSDQDANRFDNIFKDLGFETIMRRDLSADKMRAQFKELAAACRPEHDALFVFILSHGSEHGIYGTDGLEVYLDSEVITCFDNRNCPAMLGKPKVFVIQACRGRARDCGGDGDTTDSIVWSPMKVSGAGGSQGTESNSGSGAGFNGPDGTILHQLPDSSQPQNQHQHPRQQQNQNSATDSKGRKYPTRTDMLIVYSCLAGRFLKRIRSKNKLKKAIRSMREYETSSV